MRRFGLVHVARDPGGNQLRLCRPTVSILNAAIAPFLTSPCSMGALNLRMLRTPEGRQDPARAVASSHVASEPQMPASAKSTISLHMQRRAVDGRAVIVAADRLRVHQVDAALLARVDHVLFAFVVENGGRDLHVEVALPQPLGVGWPVVIHQFEGSLFPGSA